MHANILRQRFMCTLCLDNVANMLLYHPSTAIDLLLHSETTEIDWPAAAETLSIKRQTARNIIAHEDRTMDKICKRWAEA